MEKMLYVCRLIISPSFLEKQKWAQCLFDKLSIISPDEWTGSRIPLFLATFLCLLIGMSELAFVFGTMAIITDVIDGKVARRLGIEGRVFGRLFDAIVDRLILLPNFYMARDFIPFSMFITYVLFDFLFIRIARISYSANRKEAADHLVAGKVKFFLQGIFFYVLWMANYLCPNWQCWTTIIFLFFSSFMILSIAEGTNWGKFFQS